MNHSFRLLGLILLAIMAISVTARGAAPAAPVDVAARVIGSGGFSPVYLSWSSGDATADHYDLYMGLVTPAGTSFSRFTQVDDTAGGGTFTAATDQLVNGTYDFYVKAVNADGESPASSIVRMIVSGTAIRLARDVAYFDSTFVGTRVLRDFDAESSDGSAIVYSLSNLPSGATFNTQSGLLDWTPSEPGIHSMLFTASLVSDPSVSVSITYTVVVNYSQADLCATLSGTVRDENGANVNGIVQVTVLLAGGGSTNLERLVENGAFSLRVPRGTMIVQVLGDVFRSEYYNNVSTASEAERLTIDCNQTRALTISVTRVDYGLPDSITGRVVDATSGQGIPGARVQFFIAQGNSLIAEFETYADGSYLAVVPRDTTYKARAYDPNNQYEAEYYGGVSTPNGATTIDPRTTSSGIDFFLTPTPTHRNTIQGTLRDTAGNMLTGRIVGYRIDSTGTPQETVETWARSGEFFIFDLDPGEYILHGDAGDSMHVPGYHRASGAAALSWTDATRISIANGDSLANIAITLVYRDGFGGRAKISGEIVSKGGSIHPSDHPSLLGLTPVEGAIVYAINRDGRVSAWASSSASGHFEITGLADGLYILLVDKVGYEATRTTATATEAGTEVELQMEPRVGSAPEIARLERRLDIHPNPAGAIATIRFTATAGTIRIGLSDLMGEEVVARTVTTTEGENAIAIETSAVPSGTYILRIGEGETAISRVVVIAH